MTDDASSQPAPQRTSHGGPDGDPDPRTARVSAPAGAFIGTATDSGAVFAGIPYAQPPVGTLRFRPPQPIPDSGDSIDATRFRAAPAQTISALLRSATADGPALAAPTRGPGVLLARMAGIETSEDCLHLNIWTPDLEGDAPVLVWIFGGGFDSGYAAPPVTDGAALSRLTGTVVVSLNYRVGALGFGYWAGVGGDSWADASNLGLQDQAAALRWVRRNISAFGGDPASITVAGESAGAFSIGSLLATPARDTFDRAILHSGNAGRVYPVSTAHAIACDLLDAVGVESMEQLQQVDVDLILTAQSQVVDNDIGARNLPGGRSWGVVLDGAIVTRDPLEAIRAGEAADVPLLIGANRDETRVFAAMFGASFTPSDDEALLAEIGRAGIADPAAVLDAYRRDHPDADGLGGLRSAFLTDAVYRRPAVELAAAQRAAGGHAWSLLFSAEPFGPALGAGHGMDLIYLFDDLDAVGVADDVNLAVRDELLDGWSRFARTGDPGWPEYDSDAPARTRQVGGTPSSVTEPPSGAVREVWPLPRG